MKNLHVLEKMFRVISRVVLGTPAEMNGFIHHLLSDQQVHAGSVLEYRMGSPAPWLIKIVPHGHGVYDFNHMDLYHRYKSRPGIISDLNHLHRHGHFSRYSPGTQREYLPQNYILFTMQTLGKLGFFDRLGEELVDDLIDWSSQSRKHIVFRWHPASDDKIDPQVWWNSKMRSDYVHLSISHPIADLIQRSEQLWTISSATGLEAIIKGKPVVVFGSTDFLPMAYRASCPDDAAANIKKQEVDSVEQFLTWYHDIYCIDLRSDNLLERIRQRINFYFLRQGTPDPYIADLVNCSFISGG